MYGSTRARAVVFATVLTAASRPARAEPVGEPESPRFRLFYEAASDACPNAPAFLAAIRARTERPRLAAPGELATTFSVTIVEDRAAGHVVGRLEIREPDGARQERAVESQTCPDVAKALALVVALYLDPDAVAGPEPVAEEPATPPRPRPSAPSPISRASEPPPVGPPPFTFGVGAGGGVLGGVGPAVAPRAGVFAAMDVAFSAREWARASVRLSVDAATTNASVGAGSQRYALVAGGLRVCPVRLPLAPVVHLAPCAGMQVGLHRGTSGGIPSARAQDKTWLAPTATGSLGVDLSRAVALELEGGLVAPMVRTRFFLGPDLTLFRTPAVAGTGGVSVLVRFP
ncbi:MAG: hypothetical protein KF795_07355 [Labilithrix sp.]|nr:hypothetical protein [Labilithrix sp.]